MEKIVTGDYKYIISFSNIKHLISNMFYLMNQYIDIKFVIQISCFIYLVLTISHFCYSFGVFLTKKKYKCYQCVCDAKKNLCK